MKKKILSSGIKAFYANINKNYKFPIGIYFSILSLCNLKCFYCDYKKLNKDGGQILNIDEIKIILKEFYEAGVKKINLTGGEPLMHPDIGEIIDTIKKYNMFVSVSTNGILIPEKLNEIKNADIIMLSFDGKKENHDKMRGKNSYSKTIKSMDVLKQNNIKFWTTTTLNKYNVNDIDFVLDTVSQYNSYANFVLLQYFSPKDDINSLPAKEKIKNIILSSIQIRKVFAYLLNKKKQGFNVGSTNSFLKFMLNWENYENLTSSKKYNFSCFAGRLYAHFYYDKTIYSCGHCRGNIEPLYYKPGNFKEQFYKLQKLNNCNSCRVACDAENNLIYSLNLNSIFNWLSKF